MKTLLSQNNLVFNPPMLGCVLFLSGLPGSGSKIYDRSPYGNIGTMVGATWKRLPSGLWCLSFDGSDDAVTISNSDSLKPLTDSWTVKVWFNTAINLRQFLLSIYGTGEDYFAFELYDQKQLRFYMFDSVGGVDVIAGNTQNLHDGKWHHTVAVRSEQDGKLYLFLDGVSDATPVNATNTTGRSIEPPADLDLAQQGEGSFKLNGSLALLEVVRGPWNAFDVQNSRNQEKHLFGVW